MARRERQRRRRAQNPGPRPSEPHRDNVPGPLEHASGEADEFEAALVAGAGGEAADDANAASEEAFGRTDDDVDEVADEELADEADSAGPAARRATGTRGAPTAHQPAGAHGNRVIGFLRACWAELQRVQWPDRRQVGQATAVVLGFVVIAGAYLGLADVVAQRVIDFIL
jgi:preprotein translocase SecE subunit